MRRKISGGDEAWKEGFSRGLRRGRAGGGEEKRARALIRKGTLRLYDPHQRQWTDKKMYLAGHFLRYKRNVQVFGTNGSANEINLRGASLSTTSTNQNESTKGIVEALPLGFVVFNAGVAEEWILAASGQDEKEAWQHDIAAAIKFGEESYRTAEEEEEMTRLVRRMRMELDLRDRVYHLKTYSDCFLGEDAISWLQSEGGGGCKQWEATSGKRGEGEGGRRRAGSGCSSNSSTLSLEDAQTLGRALVTRGLVYHVAYDYEELENRRLFYRFASLLGSDGSGSRGVSDASNPLDNTIPDSASSLAGASAPFTASAAPTVPPLAPNASSKSGIMRSSSGSGSSGNSSSLSSPSPSTTEEGRARLSLQSDLLKAQAETESLRTANTELQLELQQRQSRRRSEAAPVRGTGRGRLWWLSAGLHLAVSAYAGFALCLLGFGWDGVSPFSSSTTFFRSGPAEGESESGSCAPDHPLLLRSTWTAWLHAAAAVAVVSLTSLAWYLLLWSTEAGASAAAQQSKRPARARSAPRAGQVQDDVTVVSSTGESGYDSDDEYQEEDAASGAGEEDGMSDVSSVLYAGEAAGRAAAVAEGQRKALWEEEKESEQSEQRQLRQVLLGTLPPPQEWPQWPLLARLSPLEQSQVPVEAEAVTARGGRGGVRKDVIIINNVDEPFEFETDLFKGRVIVRVVGLGAGGVGGGEGGGVESGEAAAAGGGGGVGLGATTQEAYFKGRKRRMQCVVQGTFKKAIPFEQVYTGQAFVAPFTNFPAKWLVRRVLAFVKTLSPGLKVELGGSQPYFMSPLAATAQVLRVEEAGNEIRPAEEQVEETQLLGPEFRGDKKRTSAARKSFFSSTKNLPGYAFEPGKVYTMEFYQHLLDLVPLQMDLGFRRVDLGRYLNHHPVQIMAKHLGTSNYLWNIELYHHNLLPEELRAK